MSSLFDYNDAYILVEGTITVKENTAAAPDNYNKQVVFKSCETFTDCIIEINSSQIYNANDLNAVILMSNMLENSKYCSKVSGNLFSIKKMNRL